MLKRVKQINIKSATKAVKKMENIAYAPENLTSEIFENQVHAAKFILKHFSSADRFVMLLAMMQAGKTGVISAMLNALTYRKNRKDKKLHEYLGIDNIFVVTGMNENETTDQNIERIYGSEEKGIMAQAYTAVEDGIIKYNWKSKNDPDNFFKKNSSLRQIEKLFPNTLLIIDESHFGTDKSKNVLIKKLGAIGEMRYSEKLAEQNSFILSVSATPFSELASDLAKKKKIVLLEPGEKYVGLRYFQKLKLIHNVYDDDNNINSIDKMNSILVKTRDRMTTNGINYGLMIFRIRDNRQDWIYKNAFLKKNFGIVHMNQDEGNINIGTLELALRDSKSEEKPYVIFIKGSYMAGKTLESDKKGFNKEFVSLKDHIWLVYEQIVSPESSLQGLIGRMCGYRNDKKTIERCHFYINDRYVDDYLTMMEDPSAINSINIPGNTSNKIKNVSQHKYDVRIEPTKDYNFEIKLSVNALNNLRISDGKALDNLRFARKLFNLKVLNTNRINKLPGMIAIDKYTLIPEEGTDYFFLQPYLSGKTLTEGTVKRNFVDSPIKEAGLRNIPNYRDKGDMNSLKEFNKNFDKTILGMMAIQIIYNVRTEKLRFVFGEVVENEHTVPGKKLRSTKNTLL